MRGTVGSMPRPYTDTVEIITAPVPATSPFIPTDAKIVVGAVAPASPDPIPIVLLPGFEYRMREWRHPETHEVHWRLERRNGPPRAGWRPPRPKGAPAGTRAEAATFLAATGRDPLGLMFRIAVLRGLRRGELCGLRWASADLEA